jgi:hypothetical protein
LKDNPGIRVAISDDAVIPVQLKRSHNGNSQVTGLKAIRKRDSISFGSEVGFPFMVEFAPEEFLFPDSHIKRAFRS